jgi:hypothetical protein
VEWDIRGMLRSEIDLNVSLKLSCYLYSLHKYKLIKSISYIMYDLKFSSVGYECCRPLGYSTLKSANEPTFWKNVLPLSSGSNSVEQDSRENRYKTRN